MKVHLEGVTLHLAHPDELAIRWVGQEELMRQLLAAWMVVIIVARELAITGLRLLAVPLVFLPEPGFLQALDDALGPLLSP